MNFKITIYLMNTRWMIHLVVKGRNTNVLSAKYVFNVYILNQRRCD